MTAALKAANAMTDFNSGITIGEQTLVKLMAQRYLLVSQEPRHNKIRKNIEGFRRRVAHLHISALMSEKVVHSVPESENPKDSNGFSANESGPLAQSKWSTTDESGPDGSLFGTENSGSEAESVHRVAPSTVENTHEIEAVRPDGPNGPLISEGETPDEPTDDAVSPSQQADESESPSDDDDANRDTIRI